MNPSTSARLATLATLTALLAACGGGGGGGDGPIFVPPAPPPAPTACVATPPPPAPAPGAQPPQVTLAMSNSAGVNGNVVLTLNPTAAPVTTANFLAYVNAGFYNCTVIHRHAPNFVLQGGGYTGPLVAGGTLPTLKPPTRANIVLEDNAGQSNLRLTVAMARTSLADSANSQFFFNLADNLFLNRTAIDRGYAVFGSVTSGSEVVTAMTAAPCIAWPAFLDPGECLPSPNITITAAAQTR
jgi:cyclophilin family peptidyl-prolyl cis-trans isomerase